MNGEFSDFFVTQTMPQSNITVICSKFGEYPQRLFCLSLDIIDHDISAAAEQNKKVGVGRWGAENKIGNSVSERKNFTPMWSHVF